MHKFYLRLALLSLLVALALLAWNNLAPTNFTTPLSWYALAFFIVATCAIHYFLHKSSKQSPQVFIRSFMAITTFKLLAYLLFIVIFLMSRVEGAKIFVLHFLVLYFIFTAFETYQLFKVK